MSQNIEIERKNIKNLKLELENSLKACKKATKNVESIQSALEDAVSKNATAEIIK